MSTDRQETSITDQRTAVVKFAADNGYRIVREYKDEGISGWKSEQRKGFQQLIEDTKSGDFQAVLCWDQDRFSRFPVLEANHYWYLLDRAGVHLTTVAQGRLNFEDLGEWLKASVVQHGKAEYLRDLARNTARGLRKMKLEGRWLSGAPLGYRLNNGRLELGDEAEVATVRRIYEMRVRGYGCYIIAKSLNQDGIRTGRGSNWQAVSVRHILKSDAYLGHTFIGKKARGKYERVIEGTATIENTHPPIIDQETAAAVARMWSTQRGSHIRGNNEGAPLAGLVKCGRCGETMYSACGTKYVCGTYRTKGKCGSCWVHRAPLLAAVAAKIREHVLLGSRQRLEDAIQRQLDRRAKQVPDAAAMRRELEALDRKISRAADRILSVDDSLIPDVEKRLLMLKHERDQLIDVIEAKPATKPLPSAKAIAARLWELDRILAKAPATTVRHTLSQFIDHIRLDFKPLGKSFRGNAYRFTGGMILLRTQADNPGTGVYLLGTTTRIRIMPDDIAA
jgi:DNA invertase Pin-like site-specific DNA recombinase